MHLLASYSKKMKETHILFVCKYNRFRSKLAEDIFKRINGKSNIKVKSAGVIRGNSIDKNQAKVVRSQGFELKGPPRGISSELLRWQDILVIVANDVPKGLFKDNKRYGRKTILWKIPDAKTNDDKEIIRIVSFIKKKVERLVEDLG